MSERLKIHPFCDAFPEMQGDEFDELVRSMKEQGYDEGQPIVLYEGMVLDGRHRMRAAEMAGVSAPVVEFEGTAKEALQFVERRNLHRRNLSVGQRAACAAALLPHYKASANLRSGKAAATAARAAGVSTRSVESAARVAKADPKLAGKVKDGKITLSAAEKLIKAGPPERPPAHPALARVDEFKAIVNQLHAARRGVEALAEDTLVSRQIRLQQIVKDIENAVAAVKFATPFAACTCGGKEGCEVCVGSGWIIEDEHARLPKKRAA